MNKIVYHFGGGTADGDGSMKALLGGKGANLAEMARIGLPVPPGFTITTEVCTYYYDNDRTYPAELDGCVKEGIAKMEALVGRKFGDTAEMPLLVSVRSGARESMPGMMDTILNLGLNDETVAAMALLHGERAYWLSSSQLPAVPSLNENITAFRSPVGQQKAVSSTYPDSYR